MGRCDNPLRRILNRGADLYLQSLPIVYFLTVVESIPHTGPVVRGLFVGDDHSVFERAGALSAQVNCFRLDTAPDTMVVWMDPDKYKKTWVGNKAIYRTRMAIADGGRLVVIAPGVSKFGEHEDVDILIRRYGYRPTQEIVDAVAKNEDLASNLSAAAHLVHGSTEGRFHVEYCPGGLSAQEIQSVGYEHGSWREAMTEYQVEGLQDGWHTSRSGRSFYFVRNPGLGLWMHRNHPHAF
jgi:hypothetical protein